MVPRKIYRRRMVLTLSSHLAVVERRCLRSSMLRIAVTREGDMEVPIVGRAARSMTTRSGMDGGRVEVVGMGGRRESAGASAG